MPNINVYDGKTIKSIDFSPWGGIDGFLSATSTTAQNDTHRLRSLVPWLQKAITMTGNAVSQLPYSIEDDNDNEIDPELAWGGVMNPRKYIKLIADSLCAGSGYLAVKTASRGIVSAQYVLASSIRPNYDANGNLLNFTRTMTSGKTLTLKPEELLYFWLPDDSVETGPAQVHPVANAMLPAYLIASMDSTMKQYADRGFIPPTILGVKGMPNESERKNAENWWNGFLRGWTKTAAKIINSEAVTISVLGAGMDELRGTYTEITRQQIENISAAFDIPLSLFMSNAANYATANSDRKTWYETGTFVTIMQTVEDALNTQLFSRWGWHFEFEPEKLAAFQTEEADKSGAVSTLTGTLANNPEEFLIVADILGLELSEEQKDMVKTLIDGRDNEPAPQTDTTPTTAPAMDDTTGMSEDERADQIAQEMMAWHNFAGKNHKREFVTTHIPAPLAARIRADLKVRGDVDAVFADAVADIPVIMLAQAINGR